MREKIFRITGAVASALVLVGCEMATPEGCPIYLSEIGQARTQACVAAYHEEKARQAGGVVTNCRPVGGAMSCVTY